MDTPNEEEVVSGRLLFTVDGTTRIVPELKWRANREWQARLQSTFVALATVSAETAEGQQAMADAERALVLAYDVTGALGDLEDATERDVDAIYNRLLEVSFPLAQSQTALMMGIVRAAVGSVLESSTSGRSPSGTSAAPTTSKRRSPSARRPSSSTRRRSASSASSATA